MKKQWMALLFAFVTAWAWAGMEVNTASQSDLETMKGVGPATAQLIVNERKNKAFANWDDLIERVKGLGPGKAKNLSKQGLTVSGQAFAPAKAGKSGDKSKGKSKDMAADKGKANGAKSKP